MSEYSGFLHQSTATLPCTASSTNVNRPSLFYSYVSSKEIYYSSAEDSFLLKFPSVLANQLTSDLWTVFSWSCTQLMMISSRFCCLSLFMKTSCEDVFSVCHVSDTAQHCSGRSAGLSKKKILLSECKCFDISIVKAIWATQCTENKQDANPLTDFYASPPLGNCQYL